MPFVFEGKKTHKLIESNFLFSKAKATNYMDWPQ
jgi:hypothetical protein